MHLTINDQPTTLQKGDQYVLNIQDGSLSFTRGGVQILVTKHAKLGLTKNGPLDPEVALRLVGLIDLLTGCTSEMLNSSPGEMLTLRLA